MPSDAVAKFVGDLRKYRLLPPTVDKLPDDVLSRFTEPRALAKELIDRDWLTAYQVNQLLTGRGKDLLLGSYVLLEKLGEGGMGAVFKARNWKLDRIVALKLIRKQRLAHPDAIKRFHREIRAAAQLNHPNIVRAFDADEVDGTQLLVMELVEGGIDLAKLVKQQGPLPVDEACDYVRQAALGLQHAYERGMVHRDIKPQNLLLAAIGIRPSAIGKSAVNEQDPMAEGRQPAAVVKILDMGLARVGHDDRGEDSTSTLTQEGAVMGTLDYIAPEQARDSHSVDIRADLYSLGCTLFFLLTGRVPFLGGTAAQKLMKHQLDAPPAVQAIRPAVPDGVANIVARLMAKRSEERFQTPAELAVALANPSAVVATSTPSSAAPSPAVTSTAAPNVFADLLAGDTVMSQTTPPPDETKKPLPLPWKWIAAGVGGGLVGLVILISVLFSRASDKNALEPDGNSPPAKKVIDPSLLAQQAEKKRLAEAAEAQRKREADAEAPLAALVLKAKDPKTTFVTFAQDVQEFKAKHGGTPQAIQAAKLLMAMSSPLDQLDSKKLPQDCIDAWQARGNAPPAELVGVVGEHRTRHWGAVTSVVVSRDGSEVFSAGDDGVIRRWDAATARELPSVKVPGQQVALLAISPDGETLAAASLDEIRLFNLKGNDFKEVAVLDSGPIGPLSLAFSPDGKSLACGADMGGSGGVQVWEWSGAKPTMKGFKGHGGQVRGVAFAPNDATLLATACADHAVRVWKLAGKELIESQMLKQHDVSVNCVAFTPDGRMMASGGNDHHVRLWDISEGRAKERGILKGHTHYVYSLAFSHDGKMMASGSWDGGMRLWDMTQPEPKLKTVLNGVNATVRGIVFTPNDKTLISGSADGTLRIWDVESGKEVQPATGPPGAVHSLAFSTDDRQLFTGGLGTNLLLWETATCKEVRRLENTSDNRNLALSPDGRYIVSCSASAGVCLWDLRSAPGSEARTVLECGAGVVSVAFAPDSGSFACARSDGAVDVWSLTADQPTRRTASGLHDKQLMTVAFGSIGRMMASGGYDEKVVLWDLSGPDPRKHDVIPWKEPGISAAVAALAFAPDGKTLAIGYSHALNSVHLWNLTCQPCEAGRRLERHTGLLTSVSYSPDGRLLASAAENGHVIVWNPDAGAKIREWQLPGPVRCVAFAHDGRHLATANGNGTVYILRVADGPLRTLSPDEAKKQQQDEAKRLDVPVQIENTIGMKLNLIPAGRFMMGSPESEPGREAREGLPRQVAITRSHYLGVTEVTRAQWQKVMGTLPKPLEKQDLPDRPVSYVSGPEAAEFCRKLSELPAEIKAGCTYRLPLTTEWEYACRAGSQTAYYFGDDHAMLGDHAWYQANAASNILPVAQKRPNAWGLYDMLGNVLEWCADQTGEDQIHRGGSGVNTASQCRCAAFQQGRADTKSSALGFRVLCEIPSAAPKR